MDGSVITNTVLNVLKSMAYTHQYIPLITSFQLNKVEKTTIPRTFSHYVNTVTQLKQQEMDKLKRSKGHAPSLVISPMDGLAETLLALSDEQHTELAAICKRINTHTSTEQDNLRLIELFSISNSTNDGL